MNRKKITYISYYTFDESKYNTYNIEFIGKSLDVTIIDVSKTHDKRFQQNNIKCHDPEKLFVLDNYNDLPATLKKISPDYLVSLEPKHFRNKTLKLSKKFGIKTILLDTKQTFDASESDMLTRLNYFFQILFIHLEVKFFFKNIFNKPLTFFSIIKNKFKKKTEVCENADIIFVAGDNVFKKYINYNQKVISTHSNDYEAYRVFIKNKNYINKNENLIVFLDQILYNHPDYDLIKNRERPVSKKYFLELREFFKFCKKKFNSKLSIALHPRCDKITLEFYNNFFKEECYLNQTLELVAKSRLVLSHPSTTALNFPVIFKKPLIFITTNEIEKDYYQFVTDRLHTRVIRQPFINISSKKNYDKIDNLESKDLKGYKKYFTEFIKSENVQDISLWDLFLKNIK